MRYASSQKGFTLIETIVAIGILTVAIVVPLRVVSQSVKSAAYHQELITATHLAQEGIELMRVKRDNAILSTSTDKWAWVDALSESSQGCATAAGCTIEPETLEVIPCSAGGCQLYFDEDASDGAYYTHEEFGNEETQFIRSIRFSDETANRVRVISEVSWDSSYVGSTDTTFETWLYNYGE